MISINTIIVVVVACLSIVLIYGIVVFFLAKRMDEHVRSGINNELTR